MDQGAGGGEGTALCRNSFASALRSQSCIKLKINKRSLTNHLNLCIHHLFILYINDTNSLDWMSACDCNLKNK